MNRIKCFLSLYKYRLFFLPVLVLSGILLTGTAGRCDTYLPDYGGYGVMTFFPYHEDTFWPNDAVFTSFYGLKVLTETNWSDYIVFE
ncbi:MAG: hypothetical protein IJT95_02670 [Abditibacteriota bacterium]|nr:hypothetical protein [Abditibacteriota bacterium]